MNLLDLFSGIGGFSLGIKKAKLKIDYHGFSDIDEYANNLYERRFPNAQRLGSIVDVSYDTIGKNIDLLTGGFPCQAFSIAGKRRGFNDTRGTLFFEIERLLRDFIDNGHPIPCILLENVKGLLSHDNGRTFTTIYRVLTNLNYTLECQLVNTRWFLPQNRERIFIFGRYNGNRSGRKVFPIGENDAEIKNGQINIVGHSGSGGQKGIIHSSEGISSCLSATDYKQPKQVLNQIGVIEKDSEATRVYDTSCARTIKNGGGMGAKTGLYKVHSTQPRSPDRPSLKYSSGGSGPLSKEDGTTYCLDTGNTQAVEIKSAALRTRGEKQESNRGKKLEVRNDKVANSITTHQLDSVLACKTKIRKLTPLECERLQGFPDGWTEGQSDTQRYKQLGNAVSVPVITAIVKKIYHK